MPARDERARTPTHVSAWSAPLNRSPNDRRLELGTPSRRGGPRLVASVLDPLGSVWEWARFGPERNPRDPRVSMGSAGVSGGVTVGFEPTGPNLRHGQMPREIP